MKDDKKVLLSQYIPIIKDMIACRVRKDYIRMENVLEKHKIRANDFFDLQKFFVEEFGIDPRTIYEEVDFRNNSALREKIYSIDEWGAKKITTSPPFKKINYKLLFPIDDNLNRMGYRLSNGLWKELEETEEEYKNQVDNLVTLIYMLRKQEISKEVFFDEYFLTPISLSLLRWDLSEKHDVDPRIIFTTEYLFLKNKESKKLLEMELKELKIEKKEQVSKKLEMLKNPTINRQELIQEFINAKNDDKKRIEIIEKYKLNNLLFNGYREHFTKKENIHPRMLYTEVEIYHTKWLLNILKKNNEKLPVAEDIRDFEHQDFYLNQDEYIDLVIARAEEFCNNKQVMEEKLDSKEKRIDEQSVNKNMRIIRNMGVVNFEEQEEEQIEKKTTRGRPKWKNPSEKKDQKTMIFTTKALKEKIRKYSEEAKQRGEIMSQTGAISEYIVNILEKHFLELEQKK